MRKVCNQGHSARGFSWSAHRASGRSPVHAPPFSACAYRKSYPAILMVQSAQDRAADDLPNPLDAARDRGIIVQRQMSSRGVVVIFKRQQNVAQMAFTEDYDMIDAFPPD